jgi:hypothetical protein
MTASSLVVAETMNPPRDPRFTGDWGAQRKLKNAGRAAVQARWDKQEEARQAESRRAHEASLRR